MNEPEPTPTMIPIKILCPCGQKYAFDVEPVGGRMVYAVHCPVCGADGTAEANAILARRLPASVSLRLCIDETHLGSPSPPPPVSNSATSLPACPGTRRWWWLPVLGGSLTLALTLFACTRGKIRDSAATAAAVNDGLPRTLAQLNGWYREPLENGAILFLQGFEALHLGNVSASSLPFLGQGEAPPIGFPLAPQTRSAAAAFLRANRDALQSFAQGAQVEQSRYPADLTLGFFTPLPHLPQLKRATLLMELAAVSHADARDARLAGNDVRIALALARSLETEPNLFSQLVRASCVANAVAAFEQTLNRVPLPAEILGDLSKALKEMEDYEARGEGFKRGLVAERASWLALLDNPPKLLELLSAPGNDLPAADRDRITVEVGKGRALRQDQRWFEEAFRQLMVQRGKAFPDRLKADEQVRQRLNDAAAKRLAVVEVMLRGLAGPAAKEAGSLAQLRLGLTAAALEQFCAAHDRRYPAALSELIPDYLAAVPVDPFDGRPLRYQTRGSGYRLYSIGPDLIDNSGERFDGRDGDLVFEVVAAARAGT